MYALALTTGLRAFCAYTVLQTASMAFRRKVAAIQSHGPSTPNSCLQLPLPLPLNSLPHKTYSPEAQKPKPGTLRRKVTALTVSDFASALPGMDVTSATGTVCGASRVFLILFERSQGVNSIERSCRKLPTVKGLYSYVIYIYTYMYIYIWLRPLGSACRMWRSNASKDSQNFWMDNKRIVYSCCLILGWIRVLFVQGSLSQAIKPV